MSSSSVGSRHDGAVLYAGKLSWRERPSERPWGPGWLLTYTIAGQALYRIASGFSWCAPAGDLALVACGAAAERGVQRGDSWDAFGLRFEPWKGWAPEGFERVADGVYRAHITRPGMRTRVHEAYEEIIADVESREITRMLGEVTSRSTMPRLMHDEAIESELVLLRLREIFLVSLLDAMTTPRLDARIRVGLEILEHEFAAPLTMRELAARAGLSYSHFVHVFTSQVGVSPKRVQRNIRLRRAAVQLEYSDDPVGSIAVRTGFGSIFDFSRTFRREFGVSPTMYRAKHR
jgi:AraC family transcriptional regulator, arabinose operon regulatory protein